MDDLTQGIKPPLHYLEAPVSRAPRLVEQVVVCADTWSPTAGGDGQIRGALVIAPSSAKWLDTAGETERRMRVLERQGAVGLVVAAHARDVPLLVQTASRRGTLPLMVPAFTCNVTTLQTILQRHQIEALRHHARQQARLLEMTPRLDLTGEGPQRLIKWLERQTGARVTIIRERTDPIWRAMAEAGNNRLLTDLRNGRVSTGTLDTGGQHYVLHAVGNTAPHRILAARRPTPWPYPARTLVPKVCGQLTLVTCQQELQAREQRLAHTEMASRASVLQALMSGDIEQAKHAAAPLLPNLLTSPTVEIAILECPPGADRRALAARCDQALGWQALTVLHPTETRQIVICHPHNQGAVSALDLLSPGLRSTPQVALGMSAPLPWVRAAQAYDGALKALETARNAPERTAVYDSGASLADVLSPRAQPWATALLRPVWEAESQAKCRCLLETARLAATFGPVRAAEVLGEMVPDGQPSPHRNTVSKRFLTVGQRTGLGTRLANGRTVLDLGDRAVLDLAIQLLDGQPGTAATPQQVTSLHSLLRSDPAVAEWADRLLEPLSSEQEKWLITWLTHDQDTQRTAHLLGVHPNTVRSRIDTAGNVISRPLLDPGNGPHDLLFALTAKGKLPLSRIPDPVAATPARSPLETRTAA
ncbi:helix-turn-helix domain-containing protein [Streptomyces albus]|uniref:helix-turn-helix domain-containing protein n=1 Tax=Streptomyces albus TaxID=1888 RepID=UPI0033D06411